MRRWCALALVRMGEPPSALAEALLRDPEAAWRRPAALAFAERGDAARRVGPRGVVGRSRAAWTTCARPRSSRRSRRSATRLAVPALARSLDDVRLRPFVADALGRRSADPFGPPAARRGAGVRGAGHVAHARSPGAPAHSAARPGPRTRDPRRGTVDVPRAEASAPRAATAPPRRSRGGCGAVQLGDDVESPVGPASEPASPRPSRSLRSAGALPRTRHRSVSDDAGVEALFLSRAEVVADADAGIQNDARHTLAAARSAPEPAT